MARDKRQTIEAINRLRESGHTGAAIAAHLGLSENYVIWLCSQLKLSKRGPGIKKSVTVPIAPDSVQAENLSGGVPPQET